MTMLQTEKSPARLALVLTIVLAGSFLIALLGFGGSSNAQVDPYASGSPTVLPTQIITSPGRTDHTASPGESPDESPSVLPTRLDRDRDKDGNDDDDDVSGILPTDVEGGTLPFTGGDLVLFAATGASIIGTGTLLVRRSRKR